ncbi:MAG: cupin domain-containing protein [Actinomycetota bacterium]|nr:cupin domain-containing protein [Actinomycetota bacterium]
MPSLRDPDFDEERDHPGFRCRRARLGRQAGGLRLGASLFEVPPGQAAYPYHFHLAEEELVFVLQGRPSLRHPGGWREMDEGEVIAFPVGEEGAHQIVNRTDATVRLLAISTSGTPDVVIQPDSGKLGAFERRPDGGRIREWYRRSDAVGYWDGERAPVH